MGRTPNVVISLFDNAMENTALAIDEQEVSKRGARKTELLEKVCRQAFADGHMDGTDIADIYRCIAAVRKEWTVILGLNVQDEAIGRELSRDAEAVVARK